jgi:hypothetical protein
MSRALVVFGGSVVVRIAHALLARSGANRRGAQGVARLCGRGLRVRAPDHDARRCARSLHHHDHTHTLLAPSGGRTGREPRALPGSAGEPWVHERQITTPADAPVRSITTTTPTPSSPPRGGEPAGSPGRCPALRASPRVRVPMRARCVGGRSQQRTTHRAYQRRRGLGPQSRAAPTAQRGDARSGLACADRLPEREHALR